MCKIFLSWFLHILSGTLAGCPCLLKFLKDPKMQNPLEKIFKNAGTLPIHSYISVLLMFERMGLVKSHGL